jgi:hypothetical protein
MLQQELVKKVIEILNICEIPYVVTGSVVSSLQGEPRATHDTDIIVVLSKKHISLLIPFFPTPNFYLSEDAISEAIIHKSMFNLIDTQQGNKVDFWLLTDEYFDLARFQRRYQEDFFGMPIYVTSPEDTILAKMRWSKLSGGSQKQMTDALRVYELQFGILNIDYINFWVEKLELTNIWIELQNNAIPL